MSRKIKAIFLSVFLSTSSILLADSSLYPYISTATFGGHYKKSDYSAGMYGDYKEGGNLFKLNYEYKKTNYHDLNVSADNFQHDFIAGYSGYANETLLIDATAHFIASSLKQADKNQIYLLGVNYVRKDQFLISADFAYSHYNGSSLTKSLWQITPSFSFWFGEEGASLGRILLRLSYSYIDPLSTNANASLSKRYNTGELSFKQFTTNFTNLFSLTFGKGLYLVKDKGFTVYNNNEIHTMILALSSMYHITQNTSVQLSYVWDKFDEYDPLMTTSTSYNDVNSHRFLLAAQWRF